MHTFSHDDLTLGYDTYGDPTDEPLVLIHGLGANHSMWQPQIDRYPAEGYYLIVPDVRGHGTSDPVTEFRLGDCASDITALLAEVDVEAAHVVGVSLGGLIAQQFAIAYPDRLTKLVLADTYSSIHGVVPRLNTFIGMLGISLLPRGWLIKAIEWQYSSPEDEYLRQYFRSQFQEIDQTQLQQARHAANHVDFRGGLAQITVPTLVTVGGENPGWFIKLSQETAASLTDSQFTILPGGRDPSNLTTTHQFDDAIFSFLPI